MYTSWKQITSIQNYFKFKQERMIWVSEEAASKRVSAAYSTKAASHLEDDEEEGAATAAGGQLMHSPSMAAAAFRNRTPLAGSGRSTKQSIAMCSQFGMHCVCGDKQYNSTGKGMPHGTSCSGHPGCSGQCNATAGPSPQDLLVLPKFV